MTNIQVGDRVRVLWVEEMLELNAEIHEDQWGEWVQFYDGDDNEIHDAMFPIDDDFQKLEGKIFTVRKVLRSGKIDLVEDEFIGFAVTKEMVRRVEDII